MSEQSPPVGAALRLLRRRLKIRRQHRAAARVEGWKDGARALSFWETGRKMPSLPVLYRYLRALDLDLADLQTALDEVTGRRGTIGQQFADLEGRVTALEQQGKE